MKWRILHTPADVGGNAFALSRAERELGYHSDVAVFAAGPFGYDADIRFDLEDMPVWRRFALRARFLRRALRDYDMFHYNFGQSLMSLAVSGHVLNELRFVQRAGKLIVVTYQGCDVRPQAACNCTSETCAREDPMRGPRATSFLQVADRVFYLNPDLRQWLPGASFLAYSNVDPHKIAPVPAPDGEEIVVLHAPTNREVKGTADVIATVESLRGEGIAVRLDLVEGVPHDEALRRFAAADIVVDQLRIGWYGGLAVEAMATGRPVLCYIREDTPEDNPFGSALPIVRTDSTRLGADLRALIARRDRRLELGAAGRAFVQEHHDPRAIARSILDGLVPPGVRR
jgi:glycosyltransferase involved in cell wall biosynthesis